MARSAEPGETRHGVTFSSLDSELAAGMGVTKRALVDYLEGIADRLLPELRDRPVSVIRSTRGQRPFMQKNLPDHAPAWIPRATMWAESSQRQVDYALVNDLRTLMWFANQRAVEFHVPLVRIDALDAPTHLVVDIDPPEDAPFAAAVAAAHLVRRALTEVGLAAAVKTSGAKGVHIVVPITGATAHDAALATRAIAARAELLDPGIATTAFMKEDRHGRVFIDATRGGLATVVSVYSPRLRAGGPVSWPVAWDDLDGVAPGDVTIVDALDRLGDTDPWPAMLGAPMTIPAVLVDEGRGIPTPRVAAMHEGRRRARTRRADG